MKIKSYKFEIKKVNITNLIWKIKMSHAAGNKLPEKKKNDLLKKFLNAQEYTKTLKVFFI